MASPRIISATLGLMFLAAPAVANEPVPGEACTFAGPALRCAAAADEKLETIVLRFAHPDTGALFTALGDDTSGYRTERSRELLRQSLERNNERSIALLERAGRARDAGHISQSEFEEVRRLHLRAFANYRAGIVFYQRAQWFDPAEPKDFAPRDLVPPPAPTG